MTMRFKLCSLIFPAMSAWVSEEQVKRLFSTKTTFGRVLAYSTTSSTLITPAMLMPQEHTNTPMRGASAVTSFSGG